ncbi:MAG: CpaF family protein [Acidimicrobiia bacterium]|nr:CpaF family protein [Acidimicrobiia bacterium]
MTALAAAVRNRIVAGAWAGLPLRTRILRIAAEEAVIPVPELETVAAEIAAELTGLGPLEALLADPGVTEVMVNGPSEVWVERNGDLERTEVTFGDDDAVLALVERAIAPAGLRVDAASPTVDARLPDGSRVHAVIPPLARNGPVVTIRRFVLAAADLDDLVARSTLTAEAAAWLRDAVASRRSVLVAGATSSGKTTFLNVLAGAIPSSERLITIEDAAELALAQPHVVALQARPPGVEGTGEVTVRELVRNALRMRPDRIIVGEVRGPEAVDMLTAMSTGHPGSLGTIHAAGPDESLRRLETMILLAEPQLPAPALRRQIADAVDVVVQLDRCPDGSRVLRTIAETAGVESAGVRLRAVFTRGTDGILDRAVRS